MSISLVISFLVPSSFSLLPHFCTLSLSPCLASPFLHLYPPVIFLNPSHWLVLYLCYFYLCFLAYVVKFCHFTHPLNQSSFLLMKLPEPKQGTQEVNPSTKILWRTSVRKWKNITYFFSGSFKMEFWSKGLSVWPTRPTHVDTKHNKCRRGFLYDFGWIVVLESAVNLTLIKCKKVTW